MSSQPIMYNKRNPNLADVNFPALATGHVFLFQAMIGLLYWVQTRISMSLQAPVFHVTVIDFLCSRNNNEK